MPTQYQLSEQINELKHRIESLEEENIELRCRIDELERENQELKKENQQLKDIIGKTSSKWQQTGDRIHRTNPHTNKFESYKVPVLLNERKIEGYKEFKKKFILQKKKPERYVNFYFPIYAGILNYYYEMPLSAFKFIKEKSEKTTKVNVDSIITQMKKNGYDDITMLTKIEKLLRDVILEGTERINISNTAKRLNIDRNTVKNHLGIIKQHTKGEYISDETGRWRIVLPE